MGIRVATQGCGYLDTIFFFLNDFCYENIVYLHLKVPEFAIPSELAEILRDSGLASKFSLSRSVAKTE